MKWFVAFEYYTTAEGTHSHAHPDARSAHRFSAHDGYMYMDSTAEAEAIAW